MFAQELEHKVGTLLADLAQHPADRLADEELALTEHRRGETREQREVARLVAQRP